MTVPRCQFLEARNEVDAINSLVSGVLRESSRTVCLFCIFENNFEVCECTKWVSRVLVIVTDLFQN